MKISTSYYENIYEEFKLYHPYMVRHIVEVRPWGSRGIQVTLDDNTRFNYDAYSHGVRRYEEYNAERLEDVTEEACRDVFATNLIEIMDTKGFNQISLSERSGLSSGVIHNYINKKTTPTLTALRKLAYALGCSIGDLTGC